MNNYYESRLLSEALRAWRKRSIRQRLAYQRRKHLIHAAAYIFYDEVKQWHEDVATGRITP